VLESGTEIIGASGRTAVTVRDGGTLDVRNGATVTPPVGGGDVPGIEPDAVVYDSFSGLLAGIAADAGKPSASYKISRNFTNCAGIVSLTPATGPASLTIDGGGFHVSGFKPTVGADRSISITVGPGGTLTLKNITFSSVPFVADAGGVLVLESGTEITGLGGEEAVEVREGGTLDVRDGASVINTPAIGFN
jgi:hypothetical protein